MKSLVIIPTYNERETLPLIIDSVLKHDGFDILVIDDSSPDGTAQLVKEIMSKTDRVFLIERSGKNGLGTAYVEGFKWGLKQVYDYFIEMDADGSHNPDALPLFVEEMKKGRDLIIGSRYLNRTISVVGWDFRRLMLSKFGNYYAAWILGLKVTDLTSGFRCFSLAALTSIDFSGIHSMGYGFQIEMAYRAASSGCTIGEMPIIFYERTSGASKMSKKIIREAVILPWRLRIGRLMHAAGKDLKYNLRTIIGFLVVIAGLAGGIRLGWWLNTEGDIIEIIHNFKMGLPGWAWTALKISLSTSSAALFIGLLLTLAMAIFAGGRRK